MFDPMLDSRVVEQRKQDLLRQARIHHARRQLLGCPRALHQRWLAMMADLMIASGTRLKSHYDSTRQQPPQHVDSAVMDIGWTR